MWPDCVNMILLCILMTKLIQVYMEIMLQQIILLQVWQVAEGRGGFETQTPGLLGMPANRLAKRILP